MKRKEQKRTSLSGDTTEEKIKEILAIADERRRARRFLDDLKRTHPKTRKMDLLPVTLHRGGIAAAELLIEDIKRNQKLEYDDEIYLMQFEEELKERKNRLVQGQGVRK